MEDLYFIENEYSSSAVYQIGGSSFFFNIEINKTAYEQSPPASFFLVSNASSIIQNLYYINTQKAETVVSSSDSDLSLRNLTLLMGGKSSAFQISESNIHLISSFLFEGMYHR